MTDVAKKKRVRKKKSRADLLDPHEYIAAEYGKELIAPVAKLPKDCYWYAWKGPADAAALFFDVRKFDRFNQVAKLTDLPDGATDGCVFL